MNVHVHHTHLLTGNVTETSVSADFESMHAEVMVGEGIDQC